MRLTLIILLLIPSLAFGATYYVQEDASGTDSGLDWTNAYPTLPGTLERGSTYLVGGGTYVPYNFNDNESGTDVIYIHKATAAVHGTDTGWSSAFADTQAHWTGSGDVWQFNSDYWEVDGVAGAGDGSVIEHGFKVSMTSTADLQRGIDYHGSNILLSHTEVFGMGRGEGIDPGYDQDAIYMNGAFTDNTISHCYLHEWKRMHLVILQTTDIIVEYCYMKHNDSTSGAHGQSIQIGEGATTRTTIRYSTFENCEGTGLIVAMGPNLHTDVKVYGNVFFGSDDTYGTSLSIGTTTGDRTDGYYVYNNTFYGLTGRATSGFPNFRWDADIGHANIYFQNNLVVASSMSAAIDDSSNPDYNGYWGNNFAQSESNIQNFAGDPFTNSGSEDFTLSAATDAGVTLSAEYMTDMLGNTRGADGVVDRGAFEFVDGALTATITAPTAAATYATSTQSMALGGTASYSSTITSVAWANSQASTAGTCTGTTTWTCAAQTLVSGGNAIRATVTAADASTASTLLTVTYTPALAGTVGTHFEGGSSFGTGSGGGFTSGGSFYYERIEVELWQ